MAGIIGLLLLFISVGLQRFAPIIVHAEELLTRAAAAEQRAQMDSVVQRLRLRLSPAVGRAIQVRPFSVIREVDSAVDVPPADSLMSGLPAALVTAASRYPFDPRQPLSVAGFITWRAGLRGAHDYVTVSDDLLLLRTTTVDDPSLRLAELAVRQDTYHAMRLSLVLANIGRLDVEEIARSARPRPLHAVERSVSQESAPDMETLDRAELDARLILRTNDFDLGRAAQVYRSATDIRVDGRLPTKMATRLAALPRVRVSPGSQRQAPLAPPAVPSAALARWLDRAFGQAPVRHVFLPRLQTVTWRVEQRLDALGSLATRYSEETAQRLSPTSRASLELLVTRHHAELTKDLILLKGQLTALEMTRRKLTFAQAHVPGDWRRRVNLARPEARRVGRMVRELMALDDLPRSERPNSGQSPLGAAFERMWQMLNTVPPSS
jgi:hypothetical protein